MCIYMQWETKKNDNNESNKYKNVIEAVVVAVVSRINGRVY